MPTGGAIQQGGAGHRGQVFLWFPSCHGKHPQRNVQLAHWYLHQEFWRKVSPVNWKTDFYIIVPVSVFLYFTFPFSNRFLLFLLTDTVLVSHFVVCDYCSFCTMNTPKQLLHFLWPCTFVIGSFLVGFFFNLCITIPVNVTRNQLSSSFKRF